jgi:hypothetical protein
VQARLSRAFTEGFSLLYGCFDIGGLLFMKSANREALAKMEDL